MRARKRPKSRRLLRWAAIVAFCLVALGYYQPARRYLDARNTVATRQAEVQRLQATHHRLARLVAASTSDATIAVVFLLILGIPVFAFAFFTLL